MIIWHVETSAGARFDWAKDEEHFRRQLIEYYNETCKDSTDKELADDATLDEATEAIEDYESLSYEEAYGVYMIDRRERDTLLAALRVYQHFLEGTTPDPAGIVEIAQDDHNKALGVAEIDDLCERINT
jgi:hypothetical protein